MLSALVELGEKGAREEGWSLSFNSHGNIGQEGQVCLGEGGGFSQGMEH